MRVLLRATLTLLLLASLGPAPTKADGGKAGDLKIEPHVFKNTKGEEVQAELGTLLVSENRSKPGGELIELAFVRFKSTAKNPGPPVVYLAGGPGGSGIAAARGSRFPLFMAMREVADVIALDQRGTGASKPGLLCPGSYSFPLDRPGSRDEMLRVLKDWSRDCAAHFRSQGIDLSAYNTNESADDLEDLRKALGAEKLSLWGISYGTHLALAAVRRNEKRLHKVILAGVEGPAHTLKLPGSNQKQLQEIARLIRQDPEAGKEFPDFVGTFGDVLKRLEKQPVTVEVADPRTGEKKKVAVGKFDVQLLAAQQLGDTNAIGGMPSVLKQLQAGDYSFIAGRVAESRTGQRASAMSSAMDCASGVSKERWARILGEEKQALFGRAIDFPFPEVCAAWGVADLGPVFRSPVRSRLPALFISGTLDGRTPVSNAEEVRRGFPNSGHLIIEGAGHSDDLFLSDARIKLVMLDFMSGNVQPASVMRISLPPFRFRTSRQ